MLLPSIFCILIGSIAAVLQEDFRSNLDFYSSNIGDTKYRLNDTVYPHTMHVDLDVYLEESRFDGLVNIDIEVREPNLRQIALHQKVKSIIGVNVFDADKRIVNLQTSDPFTTDDYFELILINLDAPINAGNYTITIRYIGTINENPFDGGLYKGYYFDDNNQEIAYATTQFAPYFARRAFPCFDEPQFKSRFVIAITRDKNLSPSYSNMPIAETIPIGTERIQEVFHPTPVISAYLVAFHVSDFEESASTSTDARPFKIISRRGLRDNHEWAANIGVRLTNEFDDFFGIRYHEMGQDVVMKNDHIAVPDFTFSAMENWGMVNYREAFLLYDRNHNNIANEIFIATIMSHELAHKWFGNLVTTFWWSNIWLNESFASYFEYFATHWAVPSFELDNQFIVRYVHNALANDALVSATPMNWTDVDSTSTIMAHFSTTSYDKGASVLRMMEHFVGFRNFRLALRYYLRDNAYSIATPADVYAAFNRSVSEDIEFIRKYPNVNVGLVLDSWVQNPGSPVVKVEVDTASGDIRVSQERYLLSGTRANDIWHIPLTWTHEGVINFNDTRPITILSNTSTIIPNNPGNNWVIFNIAQSGLYRVNYDEYNWHRIGNYLRGPNRQRIHKMNRAQIANDLLYFIRSGDVNKTNAFGVLEFLKDETDYYVWNAAIPQFEFILRRFEHMPEAHDEFSKYLLDLLETVIQHLGYEDRANDSTSDILNRMQIMDFACNLGHTGCVREAREKWMAYRSNESNLIPPNYRRYVYCVGLRVGNAWDYNFLLNKYQTSNNAADMAVMLRALSCTRVEASFNHYLLQSIENRKIRVHDRTSVVTFGLQAFRLNRQLVLDFLYQNYNEIRDTYGRPGSLGIVINSIGGFLTNFNIIHQFQGWAYDNQLALGESFPSAVSAIDTANSNLKWGSENVLEIYTYLLARSSSKTFVASSILVLTAILVQLLR